MSSEETGNVSEAGAVTPGIRHDCGEVPHNRFIAAAVGILYMETDDNGFSDFYFLLFC